MSSNRCSFFGHRKIEITEELKLKIKDTIEELIVKHNVSIFLFGSRSNFDELCHMIVSELKEKYSHIRRIAYTCKSETCILATERDNWQQIYTQLNEEYNPLLEVDEECEHKTKYTSNRASYVERNQAMINNSEYCIFYYNSNYLPDMLRYTKYHIGIYQPQSGTALA